MFGLDPAVDGHAIQARVGLLSERPGSLDCMTAAEYLGYFARLHREYGRASTIYVTHDQEEAMEVSDRIVVMNQGRIEQEGTPDQVYDHPATPFVLQFLGDVNLFHGRLGHAPGGRDRPEDVSYVRPHELDIVALPEPDTWPVVLSQTLTVGPNTRVEFKREDDGSYVDVELSRERWFELRDQAGGWMFRGEEINRIMGWAPGSAMAQRYASFRAEDLARRMWATAAPAPAAPGAAAVGGGGGA